MLLFRVIVFFLLGGAALCFAFYLGTGKPHFRRWGIVTFKWTIIAGLAFFGVLILERIA
jgi:hypothetical protein